MSVGPAAGAGGGVAARGAAASDGAPLLRVEDLHVHFATDAGLVRAVDGVSFDVRPGQVLGLVGESGSGKTVTSLTVMGLTRAAPGVRIAGRVLLGERDLLALPERELRAVRGGEVAMVFQDPLSALHPFHRVGAQLVEALRAHRSVAPAAARARAAELLALVGIPDPARTAEAYPHELSGGMRQRVVIAMALANEPRLLIADEPTTALDVTVQAQILDLLGRLRDELGMAVVLVTHDLGVVAELADEVAVMYAGRIVEQAPVRTLFAAPEHPYTWGLLRSVPRLDAPRAAELVPIPGRPPSPTALPTGCSFHPRCPYVREAHRHEQPPLAEAPGAGGHRVACLLEPDVRRQLWAQLQAGEATAAARAADGPGEGVVRPEAPA